MSNYNTAFVIKQPGTENFLMLLKSGGHAWTKDLRLAMKFDFYHDAQVEMTWTLQHDVDHKGNMEVVKYPSHWLKAKSTLPRA